MFSSAVVTVSTLVEGHYGISGVCLSLPAVIDRSGVRRVLPIPLSEKEVERLRLSADVVRSAVSSAL